MQPLRVWHWTSGSREVTLQARTEVKLRHLAPPAASGLTDCSTVQLKRPVRPEQTPRWMHL